MEKIILLKKINKNTFDELNEINNFLITKNIDNFVLFTSYFHYLRASKIIKSNFPKLNVYYYQEENYESLTITGKLKDYSIMTYEAISLLYNRISGKF